MGNKKTNKRTEKSNSVHVDKTSVKLTNGSIVSTRETAPYLVVSAPNVSGKANPRECMLINLKTGSKLFSNTIPRTTTIEYIVDRLNTVGSAIRAHKHFRVGNYTILKPQDVKILTYKDYYITISTRT
jgi:hypothetical protein